jgi:hypothetical protein
MKRMEPNVMERLEQITINIEVLTNKDKTSYEFYSITEAIETLEELRDQWGV